MAYIFLDESGDGGYYNLFKKDVIEENPLFP